MIKNYKSIISIILVILTLISCKQKSDPQKVKDLRNKVSTLQKEIIKLKLDHKRNEILHEIEMRLYNPISKERIAILKGLGWCVRFIADNDHFDFIFTDYLEMLHELTLNDKAPFIQKTAVKLVKLAMERATSRFDKIFLKDHEDKWDFISIIPYLYKYKIDKAPYIKFYESFPKGHLADHKLTFNEAVKARNYVILGDYLIDIQYVQFAKTFFPDMAFDLPTNHFPEYIKKITSLPYVHTIKSNEDDYSNQNYFLTHVVLVLTHFGEKKLKNGPLETRLLKYLKDNILVVRDIVKDMDLYAEFIHCLKFYGLHDSPLVKEGVQYFISRQKENGKWGDESKEEGDDPYEIFHPTWTIITAINYEG
ncbi:MAG TPA: hypothetical protein ENI73_02360 [Spirochaetes bacterium]|nr:hypothetical protein [Spirochaetota bacterium]